LGPVSPFGWQWVKWLSGSSSPEPEAPGSEKIFGKARKAKAAN